MSECPLQQLPPSKDSLSRTRKVRQTSCVDIHYDGEATCCPHYMIDPYTRCHDCCCDRVPCAGRLCCKFGLKEVQDKTSYQGASLFFHSIDWEALYNRQLGLLLLTHNVTVCIANRLAMVRNVLSRDTVMCISQQPMTCVWAVSDARHALQT